ncbi:O-antigen ligase family protein, partial [Paenibacillus sp. GCM10023250]|uniref:O-antigen ligase family protein n=1 Tax=Paenibacillus sp. GCM10023250 TaxID=3252648 RepID=UPI003619C0A7
MRQFWLGIGSLAVAAALAGAAFRYGMYFDERFYRWEWLLCLGGAAVAAGCAFRPRSAGPYGGLSAGAPAALGLLLLALLYALALLREPASVLGTLQQALRYAAYAAFVLLLHAGFGARERRAWLEAAMHASGIAVTGFALAAWLGLASFPSAILATADARLSAVGARLAGTVQYPNFLGAIAAAYWIWTLLQLARGGSVRRFGPFAACAMPYLLAGLLTESRGAWLAAAAAWAAGCALLKGRKRTAWLLYGGWTALCGAAAYRAVVAAGLRGMADGSVGAANASETALLLLLCAASAAGLYALRQLVRRAGERELGRLAWPGLAVLLAASAALLPAAIHGRVAAGGSGGGTAGARALFYRDAWTLIREAPLLGRGGDAWRSLFRQVQSQPYVGSEVHSGYAELALDLGAAGLLAGAAALALLLRPVWGGDRAGLLPIGVLLAHALIDFDMSFGYYWLLLGAWSVYYASDGEARVPPLESGRGSGFAAVPEGRLPFAEAETAPEARRAPRFRPLPREPRWPRLARRARAAVLAAA